MQLHIGSIESWKLCLNLFRFSWRVLWMAVDTILHGSNQAFFKNFKQICVADFTIYFIPLCYRRSKKIFLKIIMLNKKEWILIEFLVRRCVLLFGTVLKRHNVIHFWKLYTKKIIFLYQRLGFDDSKPSSPYIFSVEDLLMAPLMANVALYWSDSSLAWKDSLNPL